jgi:hypothetical protein
LDPSADDRAPRGEPPPDTRPGPRSTADDDRDIRPPLFVTGAWCACHNSSSTQTSPSTSPRRDWALNRGNAGSTNVTLDEWHRLPSRARRHLHGHPAPLRVVIYWGDSRSARLALELRSWPQETSGNRSAPSDVRSYDHSGVVKAPSAEAAECSFRHIGVGWLAEQRQRPHLTHPGAGEEKEAEEWSRLSYYLSCWQ